MERSRFGSPSTVFFFKRSQAINISSNSFTENSLVSTSSSSDSSLSPARSCSRLIRSLLPQLFNFFSLLNYSANSWFVHSVIATYLFIWNSSLMFVYYCIFNFSCREKIFRFFWVLCSCWHSSCVFMPWCSAEEWHRECATHTSVCSECQSNTSTNILL